MNGITYYKLRSPYNGDVTKNTSLLGSEIDNNFFTLESRDIKGIKVEEGVIDILLQNGEKISSNKVDYNGIKNIDFTFDETNGTLKITKDGIEQTIKGFVTDYTIGGTTSVNGSLVGNGTNDKPVGISPVHATGQYKPVKKIIDTLNGEELPCYPFAVVGDRYLTKEWVNKYGYLYDYEALKKIACALDAEKSGWRIPTKEDWDDMLNAVEPHNSFKDHSDSRPNRYLGKFSGRLLKSRENWKEYIQNLNTDTCSFNKEVTCACEEETSCLHGRRKNRHRNLDQNNNCGCDFEITSDTKGIDDFGFNILPAGYSNEAEYYMYFNERAYFWTASNKEYRDAYVKIFAYNKANVLQDIMAGDNFMSVRLVKDFTGDNFNEREEILGDSYSTTLMPSAKNGKAIWTTVNLIFVSDDCDFKYLKPNGGKEMCGYNKYFTNEWDGRQWLRKELKDGESVVVIEDNPKEYNNEEDKYIYSEYRVVKGELEEVSDLVYDDIMDVIEPEIESLNNAIGSIETNIEDLQGKIDNNKAETEEKLSKIEEDVKKIEESVNEVKTSVESSKEGVNSEITNIKEGLSEEKAQREEKEKEIEEKLTKLTEENKTAKEKLSEYDGYMIVKETSKFDKDTGVLLLTTKDEKNNVEIQCSFNFGTF